MLGNHEWSTFLHKRVWSIQRIRKRSLMDTDPFCICTILSLLISALSLVLETNPMPSWSPDPPKYYKFGPCYFPEKSQSIVCPNSAFVLVLSMMVGWWTKLENKVRITDWCWIKHRLMINHKSLRVTWDPFWQQESAGSGRPSYHRKIMFLRQWKGDRLCC